MYLHLGRDYVLNDRDVIGIFNLETTTISPRGREFLNYAQKHGAVVSLSDELPQSYVLADAPVDTVYLSELSPAALKRRAERPLPEGVEAIRAKNDYTNSYQHAERMLLRFQFGLKNLKQKGERKWQRKLSPAPTWKPPRTTSITPVRSRS